MIILFTSNTSGGIIQFTMQLMKSFIELGYSVKAVIPDNANYIIDRSYEDNIIRYHKNKYLIKKDPELYRLRDLINKLTPDFVLFTDDEIISLRFLGIISNYSKCILTRHDVIPHRTHFKLRRVLIDLLKQNAIRTAQSSAEKVLLLSKNSLNKFNLHCPAYKEKTLYLPLGAHVPECAEKLPQELPDKLHSYFLFFGRIDKYKGIGNLITAYSSITNPKRNLVIAGNGELTEGELHAAKANPDIILLNRYIHDEEMIYLFQNASSIVLPYLEATQSGVLSMAYHFGKPVIITKIEGLSEYVINGKTGLIADGNDALQNALEKLSDDKIIDHMSILVRQYYSDNLNWETNLTQMMKNL